MLQKKEKILLELKFTQYLNKFQNIDRLEQMKPTNYWLILSKIPTFLNFSRNFFIR